MPSRPHTRCGIAPLAACSLVRGSRMGRSGSGHRAASVRGTNKRTVSNPQGCVRWKRARRAGNYPVLAAKAALLLLLPESEQCLN